MMTMTTNDKTSPQTPPPLPSQERRVVRSDTSSATSGWAARLAQIFPDKGPRPVPAVRG